MSPLTDQYITVDESIFVQVTILKRDRLDVLDTDIEPMNVRIAEIGVLATGVPCFVQHLPQARRGHIGESGPPPVRWKFKVQSAPPISGLLGIAYRGRRIRWIL